MSTRHSYDTVAAEYAARFYGELAHKPFDRRMLDWLIDKVAGQGTICDMGCGPGQVARYLHDRGPGVPVCGIDLSPGMIAEATRLNPDLAFQTGDLLALTDVPTAAFGGMVAAYAIVHLSPPLLPPALAELRRVVQPGGVLLLSFHIGTEVRHLDAWWGLPVALDFYFHTREQVQAALLAAGWRLEEAIERDPYPEVEVPTRRAYLFARH
ncbi:MAG: class I SAM-dependent methyltransferase [Anaerolineae bacterium]|jgi:SAM-dependent methyltransferase|nr:class I SAM-dependent methyltransferase [Anaerolineae bacterium]